MTLSNHPSLAYGDMHMDMYAFSPRGIAIRYYYPSSFLAWDIVTIFAYLLVDSVRLLMRKCMTHLVHIHAFTYTRAYISTSRVLSEYLLIFSVQGEQDVAGDSNKRLSVAVGAVGCAPRVLYHATNLRVS
jgi:hypothetical protein